MSLTEDEIIEILNFIEESDFDEMRLEIPGLKLRVAKGMNQIPDQGETSMQSEPRQFPDQQAPRSTERVSEGHLAAGTQVESGAPAVLDDEGLISIKSPVLGIFYSSPKPGAPPYVEVGQLVTEDDTVCLIEVMKLFNAVKAGVRGRIAKICAESAQMVEYHQTLFLVEPMEESSDEGESE